MRTLAGLLLLGTWTLFGCGPWAEDSPLPETQDETAGPESSFEETWWLHRGFCREGTTAVRGESPSFGAPPETGTGYHFTLEEGEHLRLDVEQLETDVVVEVWKGDLELVLRIDSPTGTEGVEEVVLVSDEPTDFVLYAVGPHRDGRFRARVRALTIATDEDRTQAKAWRRFSEAEIGRLNRANAAGVAQLYQEAAALWSSIGDSRHEAGAWSALGRFCYRSVGTRQLALEAFEKTLALHRRRGDAWQEARALHWLGRATVKLGALDRAVRTYRESLGLWTRLGETREQASVLNDLAYVVNRVGEVHTAFELYAEALAKWQELGLRPPEAATRTNLGHLYMTVGDRRQAVLHYRMALRLLEGTPNDRNRPSILVRLGDALLHLDGPEAALARYREALQWSLEAGDRRNEAFALNSIGQAEQRAQRPRSAVESYQRALNLYRQEGDRLDQLIVTSNLATAYEGLGHADRARELFGQALEISKTVDAPHTELEIRHGLARIEYAHGRLEAARTHLEEALMILEELSRRPLRADMRAKFLGIRQDVFELMVSVLVDLSFQRPGGQFAEQALEVAEESRSRGFLDSLRSPCDQGRMDPESRETLSRLSEEINTLHQEQFRARQGRDAPTVYDESLYLLLERYRQVEAAACRSVSEGVSAERPDVEVPGIEVQLLLDEETLLAEYLLGADRSYLWAVTRDGVTIHLLPSREELEAGVLTLHDRLAVRPDSMRSDARRLALAEVGHDLLGPLATVLPRYTRLVVVPSGLLRALPFASLPNPAEPDHLLVESTEVLYLPSGSALAELRRARSRRPRGEGLAILADPVLHSGDPRWPVGVEPISEAELLPRLEYSAQEALQIRSLATSGPAILGLGFEAHRDRLTSGEMDGVQWLHIAGHGIFDGRTPDLSSVVLSTIDASGRPRDAHLRAYEIRRLQLSADLVTLSACETARGEIIRGEALTGLGRNFFDAGAGNVLVSLWPVHDAATSELMALFYRHLLIDGDPPSPSRALHRAQKTMLADPTWAEPFFWAAFVLYGDWHPPVPQPNSPEFP